MTMPKLKKAVYREMNNTGEYILLESLVTKWGTIPAGFIFEPSIPTIVQKVFRIDITDPRFAYPALIHDWMYQNDINNLESIEELYRNLREEGCGFFLSSFLSTFTFIGVFIEKTFKIRF